MKKTEFLELKKHLGGDYDAAKTLVCFREYLTPYGFELYVSEFFQGEGYNFRTVVSGWYEDGGIDVKWIRLEHDGSKTFLIVQCKRWSLEHIKKEDVAKFYGEVVDHKKHGNIFLVYATTTWATPRAKEFCEERSIVLLDFRSILEMNEDFELLTWIEQKRWSEQFGSIVTDWYQNRYREREEIREVVRENLSSLVDEIECGDSGGIFAGLSRWIIRFSRRFK